ncbi:MAG TPA: SUMF1/EgtB/PvdO family nonheme iron enzyme [Polyangiaceae bacterium]|nr:SUMF1/EgtB/PvdO family nonheme iron enzyme [Polyangiaceae bacterium]
MRRWLAICFFVLAGLGFGNSGAESSARAAGARRCSPEMAQVHSFCIDRWEIRTVDAASGQALSPFYPPSPKLAASVRDIWLYEQSTLGAAAARSFPLPELPRFQREHPFEPRAVSEAGALPQAYLSYNLAKRACENARKRLCSKDEWLTACRGQKGRLFPYGESYRAGRCNVHRATHPGHVLHASSSLGLLDPRLNLVEEGEDPLLRVTGATGACASEWSGEKIYDMVGNLDEWVEDKMFLGGFYARSTTKGCEAQISSHAEIYFDYSTGTRCCSDLR